MRDDDGQDPSPALDPSTDRPATARTRSKVVQWSGLALLMAATSWVVAESVSPWLVPPYLLLMAVLLSPSPARREAATNPVEGGSDYPDVSPSETPGRSPSTSFSATAGATEGDSGEMATATVPAKGRRGRSKARKGKPTPLEPAEATWVEVGPGKFVRAESANHSTVDGPHGDVGVPPDPSSTPTHLEHEHEPTIEDAPDLGLEDDWTSSELDPIERSEPAPSDPEAQAVDGITPQAEGDPEGYGPVQPGDRPEFEEDDRACIPSTESEPEFDDATQASSADEPEPVETQAPTEVPPEPIDDRPTEAVERPEPPEAPVIATTAEGDFEPITDPFDSILGPDSDVDADRFVPSSGGPWFVGRSLRISRSDGPRRLARRPVVRPRRIARDHPPRSPPWSRRWPAAGR